MQHEIEKLNKAGQGLIQSAAPGVNTQSLESDMDAMNDKWSELNARMSEQERKLDSALLQSGKYKDALQSLASWLSETEDLVSSQKQPSADYKIIKTQLQEHKFLQKMLTDRADSIRTVQAIGAELLKAADEGERHQIEEELSDLMDRWDKLREAAQDRHNALEDAMVVAREFHDKQDPFLEWLEEAERRSASMDHVGTDVGKIEEQINEQHALNEDIGDHKPLLDDLIIIGHELMKHVSTDDVLLLQEKLDEHKDRYNDLSGKGHDRLTTMEEAFPLAEEFQETHQKLLDWVAKIEPELRHKEPTGPEAEEFVDRLQRELDVCKPLIEALNEQGPQLASLSPGEAGSKVDDMLAKDNKKYSAIADQVKRRADKINLQRSKSMEVIHAIDDLIEWFGETEEKIRSAESISSDPEELRKQLRDHKTTYDDINSQKGKARDAISAAKRLRRESSMDDDPVIKDKMDELKMASDQVAALSADRLSILEQAVPLAAHFHDTHDDLQKWFVEAEEEVRQLDTPTVNAEQIKQQQDNVKVLKQNIGDHKPNLDQLNKTGAALLKLVGQNDANALQDLLDDDNIRFDGIKNGIRERSNSLEEALQQTSEVWMYMYPTVTRLLIIA